MRPADVKHYFSRDVMRKCQRKGCEELLPEGSRPDRKWSSETSSRALHYTRHREGIVKLKVPRSCLFCK